MFPMIYYTPKREIANKMNMNLRKFADIFVEITVLQLKQPNVRKTAGILIYGAKGECFL
jgi:hypothetical protein